MVASFPTIISLEEGSFILKRIASKIFRVKMAFYEP